MNKDRLSFFQDLADAARLEASDVSPKKANNQKEFTLEARKIIEARYEKYFGAETLDNIEGLEDRVVSFAPGAFLEYRKLLGSDLEDIIKDFGGFYTTGDDGNMIGLASRKKCMSLPGSEKMVQGISEALNLTRRSAIRVYRNLVFAHNVTHELLHAYEAEGLPNFFDECAVPYYTWEVQTEMGFGGLIWAEGAERLGFYAILLEGFGEDVHRLFFGGNQNEEFKEKVFSAFTPEVLEKLFPNGYGTTKEEVENFGR